MSYFRQKTQDLKKYTGNAVLLIYCPAQSPGFSPARQMSPLTLDTMKILVNCRNYKSEFAQGPFINNVWANRAFLDPLRSFYKLY